MSSRGKQAETASEKKRVDNPSENVAQNKYCVCFGYLNCSMCFEDCVVKCNWIKLCCDCNRCLTGTCQCCKVIGMFKCLAKLGFTEACVERTCRKDSAICIMFFNGIIIMVCSFVAMYIASGNMTEFGDRLEQATSFGEDYTCFSVPQK